MNFLIMKHKVKEVPNKNKKVFIIIKSIRNVPDYDKRIAKGRENEDNFFDVFAFYIEIIR